MLRNFRKSSVFFVAACLGIFGSGFADDRIVDSTSAKNEYKTQGQTSLLTLEEIIEGFHAGVTDGATHMLIVWDTWNFDDSYNFIVYSYPGQDVNDVIKRHTAPGFSKVSAVLAMHLDLDQQLNDKRWSTEYP